MISLMIELIWFNFNVKSTGETFNTNQRQTIELIKKKGKQLIFILDLLNST
jgi:hypothetical protein